MNPNGKPQYRLRGASVFLFLIAAGFADLLTFIPFVGDVVSPIFWFCAAVYLWKKGLGFINGKRLAVETISFIAELIPAVQEFPTIFIAAVAIVVMSRVEDKTGIKMPLKGGKGRNPMNKNGMRLPDKIRG